MNEPIRIDKEDRYFSEKKQNVSASPKSKSLLSKKKLIILILVLFILLLSFVIFKPTRQEPPVTNAIEQKTNSQTTNNSNEYQTLLPPSISRDATQTQQETLQDKERIEIPGEITDLLSQKIDQINEQESKQSSIALEGQHTNTNQKLKELPLAKTIEDNHYTIQITASSSLESIMAFVKLHKLTNYQIYETQRDEKPWFVLIKGNYPTRDDAKEAIKSLSQDLQKNTPWIKSGIAVNKEKLPS